MNTQSSQPQSNLQIEQDDLLDDDSDIRVQPMRSLQSTQMQNENSIANCSYQYSIVQTRKEQQIISSITFNKENRTLLVGLHCGQILIQEFFNNRKMIQKIKISSFWCPIENLIYTNKQILFIKGQDICVWIQDNANYLKFYQYLKGHTDQLNCMIINNQENLLISGGADQRIKFWERKKQIWICNKTIQLSINVSEMSFNASQLKLIIYNGKNDFQVIEIHNSQWIKAQLIKVNERWSNICFIGKKKLMFEQEDQIIQVKNEWTFCLNDCFAFNQCQIVIEKNLYIAPIQNSIQIFLINENNNFILQQLIRIEATNYVLLIDKGDWLASWTFGNQKGIQLRRIKKRK